MQFLYVCHFDHWTVHFWVKVVLQNLLSMQAGTSIQKYCDSLSLCTFWEKKHSVWLSADNASAESHMIKMAF
jgi:hypothetical protein